MKSEEARKIINMKGYSFDEACDALCVKARSLRDNLSRDPVRKRFELQVRGLPYLIPDAPFECEEQYLAEICDMQGHV